MLDPLEGLTAEGIIRTGARADRIPERFSAVLDDAVERVRSVALLSSVYVYGSVATGVARSPSSDVDLLTIGLGAEQAAQISEELSADFVDLCRAVEIASAREVDFVGDDDEAYGARVFLHHYCLHLAGPSIDRSTAGFRGDRRAARGFNGDIGLHLARWRDEVEADDVAQLGRRVARKTLLAVSGLVSARDRTWTTDRERAARRWQQLHPELSAGLSQLLEWSAGTRSATRRQLVVQLDTTVDRIVEQFAAEVGLWSA